MPRLSAAGSPPRGRKFSRIFVLALLLTPVLAGCAGPHAVRGGGYGRPADVTWKDSRWCVPWKLQRVLKRVSRRYGPVVVHSTHRWPIENWLKGGKARSWHLRCKATDFSISGYSQDITDYLRAQPEVGGYSRYPQGFYHIDTGPRRTW